MTGFQLPGRTRFLHYRKHHPIRQSSKDAVHRERIIILDREVNSNDSYDRTTKRSHSNVGKLDVIHHILQGGSQLSKRLILANGNHVTIPGGSDAAFGIEGGEADAVLGQSR
ncbi:uncharacterized protein ARMOST_20161 [Armillaria ostoyae]|uniref:Uncharacterized protein n=1 Tax=Armillaria ostoyae TaxID=47428 RepID=A0A284S6L1_ARMOS|nr:uncharacterized protein ARMOST_20161 [Armillaria ostoyae]